MHCKKDTYELISKTMGPKMNSGIKKMLEEDKKTPKKIHIYKIDEPKKYALVIGDEDTPENATYLHTIQSENIAIAITGDLAFDAVIQKYKLILKIKCYQKTEKELNMR